MALLRQILPPLMQTIGFATLIAGLVLVDTWIALVVGGTLMLIGGLILERQENRTPPPGPGGEG